MEATQEKVTHTPGPWVVEFATDKRGSDVIRTAGPVHSGATKGIEIAKLGNRVKGKVGDYRHNARLLAAAPDLLEACRMFLEDFNKPLGSNGLRVRRDTVDRMTAAIAKADAQ
jgi:hypothetical protein